ncbi:efflux RND transporter periplasmic adaptor subunit [Brevibacillus laterosporus]|uniref:efflux RND transporter periplasmic adaptor subunit n=1 Tax=Brevibacillus laterosporus TaxID=1465 RepID=UPI003D23DFC6
MNATVQKRFWILLILSLSMIVMTACSKDKEATVQPQEAKIVVAEAIKAKTFKEISELSGTLAPKEETTLSFEVAGEVKSLPFKEGDQVKKGDILAQLDSTDYSLQLALAEAHVYGANANLAKVKNGSRDQEVQQAKVAVDAKKIFLEKAQKDYIRMEQLYKSGAIPQTELENVKNALELAKKDFASAQQSYSLVVAGARAEDISSTQASYQGAVVGRNQAAATLAKTQIKAPITGTVLSKLVDVGQLASPGVPVYRIGNITQLKTVLPVPDRDISAWNVGDTVEFTLYEQKRTGKVSKIYPATNEQTGTISVEVVIDNAKHDWFPGQVVSAKRALSQKEGIFVQVEAVFSRGSGPFVYVIKDGKARKTPVVIGQYVDNFLEITSGLQAGDMLITKGADRLLDGDIVAVGGGKQHD